jgi:hypothetical protein
MRLNIVLKRGKTFWTKCKQLEYETTDGVFRWAVMLFIIIHGIPFRGLTVTKLRRRTPEKLEWADAI